MPFHRRGKKSLDNWTNSISSREMKWLCFDDKYRLFFYFVVNLGRCNYYRVAATVIFPFPIENSSMVSQWNFFFYGKSVQSRNRDVWHPDCISQYWIDLFANQWLFRDTSEHTNENKMWSMWFRWDQWL